MCQPDVPFLQLDVPHIPLNLHKFLSSGYKSGSWLGVSLVPCSPSHSPPTESHLQTVPKLLQRLGRSSDPSPGSSSGSVSGSVSSGSGRVWYTGFFGEKFSDDQEEENGSNDVTRDSVFTGYFQLG